MTAWYNTWGEDIRLTLVLPEQNDNDGKININCIIAMCNNSPSIYTDNLVLSCSLALK